DSHDWPVCVAGHKRWHDRAIDDAQPRDTANAKHWIDNRHRIMTHTASTSVIASSYSELATHIGDFLVRRAAIAWKDLLTDILAKQRPAKEIARVTDHVDSQLPVVFGA